MISLPLVSTNQPNYLNVPVGLTMAIIVTAMVGDKDMIKHRLIREVENIEKETLITTRGTAITLATSETSNLKRTV